MQTLCSFSIMPSVTICAPKPPVYKQIRRRDWRSKVVETAAEIRKKRARILKIIRKVPNLENQMIKHLLWWNRYAPKAHGDYKYDLATPEQIRQSAVAAFFDITRRDKELAMLERDILDGLSFAIGTAPVVDRADSFLKKLKRLSNEQWKQPV